ncbi:transposase domain-containing protein [Nonomuraea typhae]|uniref:Transposase domain-containing protein n=1 Tax=Nonomuraea typhae TaxID=2603600 RepID=A0ABW7YMT8_9ACTN
MPSRVGVCFLLARCLFPAVGYQLVWERMTAALTGRPRPTAKALRDLRRQVAVAPVRALFETIAGPPGPAVHPRQPVRPLPDGLLRRMQLHQGSRHRT